jgi:hypothetical protein
MIGTTAFARLSNTTMASVVVLLSACDYPPKPAPVVDQCLRAELFKSCMAALPAGPQSTKYNDWDEVVGACDNASYYQSLRQPQTIKAECRV